MSNKHLLCIKLYSRCHEVGAANMPTFLTVTQAGGAVCGGRAATGIPVTSRVSAPLSALFPTSRPSHLLFPLTEMPFPNLFARLIPIYSSLKCYFLGWLLWSSRKDRSLPVQDSNTPLNFVSTQTLIFSFFN